MSTFAHDNDPFRLEQPPALSDNEKTLSGLAWVSQILLPAVLPAVLLLTDEGKRSAFIRHHSVHALAVLVVSIIYEIALGAVMLVVGLVVPCLLGLLWVLFFLPLVPFLYYGWQAFQGRQVEVPRLTVFLRDNRWL